MRAPLAMVLLLIPTACALQATSEQCDRPRSREAVYIIDKVIAPLLDKYNYKLPAECRLDSSLDMFAKQERGKVMVRKGVWRCAYDNKARTCLPNGTRLRAVPTLLQFLQFCVLASRQRMQALPLVRLCSLNLL